MGGKLMSRAKLYNDDGSPRYVKHIWEGSEK
jgi:hypothetical protein